MRILLIEDDVILAEKLADMLEGHNIQTESVECGEDGLEMADLYEYDVVVLDFGLPDMNGKAVITDLRKKQNNVPILVLSGRSEVETRLSVLRCGGDDFLLKPFHGRELVARLHALVRRANGHCANVMQCGELVLDLESHDVRVGEQPLPLSAKEYQMLELLCLKQGGVVSKECFLNHLYGGMDEPEMKIIDVFICKLRKKIEQVGARQPVIETVWGRGYRVCTQKPN